MPRKKTYGSKPRLVRHVSEREDGSRSETIAEWKDLFGDEPPWSESAAEHVYLRNHVLARETDRGAAVLGPAYIETLLEAVIMAFLRNTPSTARLTEPTGPLSTFAAKSNLAHALGLIHDDTYHDLNLIRDIRNAFAHEVHLHSFDIEPLRQRISSSRVLSRWPSANWDMSAPGRVRWLFDLIASAIVMDLLHAWQNVKQCEEIKSRFAPPAAGEGLPPSSSSE